jgi:hypothetical protein
MQYRVFLTNFGWFVEDSFPTFDEALAKAKSTGFETTIHLGDTIVAKYSPLGGLLKY